MHNIHYPYHKNAESAKLDEETKRDLRTHHFQMGKIFDRIKLYWLWVNLSFITLLQVRMVLQSRLQTTLCIPRSLFRKISNTSETHRKRKCVHIIITLRNLQILSWQRTTTINSIKTSTQLRSSKESLLLSLNRKSSIWEIPILFSERNTFQCRRQCKTTTPPKEMQKGKQRILFFSKVIFISVMLRRISRQLIMISMVVSHWWRINSLKRPWKI